MVRCLPERLRERQLDLMDLRRVRDGHQGRADLRHRELAPLLLRLGGQPGYHGQQHASWCGRQPYHWRKGWHHSSSKSGFLSAIFFKGEAAISTTYTLKKPFLMR